MQRLPFVQMLRNSCSMSCCFFGFLVCTNLMSSTQAPISAYIVVWKDWKSGIPLWKGSFMNSKWHFSTQINHKNVHLRISNGVYIKMLHFFLESHPFSSWSSCTHMGGNSPMRSDYQKSSLAKRPIFLLRSPTFSHIPFNASHARKPCSIVSRSMHYKTTSAFLTNHDRKFPRNPMVP